MATHSNVLAWRVPGTAVAQSRTWLKRLSRGSSSSSFHYAYLIYINSVPHYFYVFGGLRDDILLQFLVVFACMSNTLDFYILSCNLQICSTHFYAKWCFCRFFRMFSVYYNLVCVFSIFCEWEEFDFFPSKCTLFSSFLALLQLWELSVQCWLEIGKNRLFSLSFIKCDVRWSLVYFWCTLLNWGSFLLLLLY